jgi:hypothetical protein
MQLYWNKFCWNNDKLKIKSIDFAKTLCASIFIKIMPLFKSFSIIILTVFNLLTYCQNCYHNDLSKQFDIRTSLIKINNVDKYHDSCIVAIIITDKSAINTIQTIKYSSIYFLDSVLIDCNHVRSYQTKKNDTIIAIDNDYGDLIVADFNFDKKDDFAIKRDSGGNGGPLYDFYIQKENGQFLLDSYLSLTMAFFPSEINTKNKTLITYVHAGACWNEENIYSYNDKTVKWRHKSHKLIDICEK